MEVSDMVQGFMGLIFEVPDNGSVLRVTMRKRGTMVVHDLMQYGKDQGGAGPPRDGVLLFAPKL